MAEWRPLPEWEHRFLVSSFGGIVSLPSRTGHGKKRKLQINPRTEYFYIQALTLDNKAKNIDIHRAVALAFIPNPENKPCVNHKNSNRRDNRVQNLEWVTSSENSKHAYNAGRLAVPIGWNRKLTPLMVRSIRSKYATGKYLQKELAHEYGLKSPSNISEIISFKRYPEV